MNSSSRSQPCDARDHSLAVNEAVNTASGWPVTVTETSSGALFGEQPEALRVGPYRLVRTCTACPEQYDVFLGELEVGYLRLRGGWFRADYPTCGGATVYEASPRGDGIFEDDEREPHLRAAVAAIHAAILRDANVGVASGEADAKTGNSGTPSE